MNNNYAPHYFNSLDRDDILVIDILELVDSVDECCSDIFTTNPQLISDVLKLGMTKDTDTEEENNDDKL